MESKNPVFARSNEWKSNGYATFDAPSSSRAAAPPAGAGWVGEAWRRSPAPRATI